MRAGLKVYRKVEGGWQGAARKGPTRLSGTSGSDLWGARGERGLNEGRD